MSVQERQEKLMDKLNLDGLSEWSPHNAAIARELLLSYHDTFVLKADELGCTSAIEHKICLNDDEPFKECFRHILLHYPDVYQPCKPVILQQTRVPNSLPMGINYVDYEPQGTEVIQACLQTTP